jgi:MFS family permease
MGKKIFYGWWIVLASFFIGLYVSSIVFYGFTAFFEPLVDEFGWSHTQVSFAASLRGLEMGIFAPLVGFLVHRFGSRRLIFCGTITIGFALILLSFTESLATFYGSFLLLGFGAGGCATVVTMSAVVNWFDKNVGKALGVMTSGFGASGLVVPLIVYLIDVYGWRTTLIILGLGAWILLTPLSFIIRNNPEQYGYLPDGKPFDDPIPQNKIEGNKAQISFKEMAKSRSFCYLCVSETIRMMTIAAAAIHVMPYLSSIGISRSTGGLVAAAIPLFSIIGRFGFGWLSDVFDKKHVMAVIYCFTAAGMLVFCNVHSKWAMFLFLLLFPLGVGGGTVLRGAMLSSYFGKDSFAKMLGIVIGAGSVGGIIGPTLAGGVFDFLGSYHFVWLPFSGLVGLAAMLILRTTPHITHQK